MTPLPTAVPIWRGRARRALALASAVAGISAGCASGGFVPPAGPSQPAPAASVAFAEATRACAAVRTIRAQLRLSGRVSGRRVPGVTVGVAVTADGQIGLEARVAGPPLFSLAGRSGEATLVLPQDRRVVVAPAGQIVDALIGVPLGPDRLLAILSGCVAPDARFADAVTYAAVTAVHLNGGDVVYLTREGGRTDLRAGVFDDVTVEYRQRQDGWPRQIVIRTAPGRKPAVSLSLRVDALERDTALPASVFEISRPAGGTPMSVEELRAYGPFGDSTRGG